MTLDPSWFAERWGEDDDPWRIARRWYERRKRDLTMAALPRERYARGLEMGCAAGHLTARLAQRCDSLLACDVAPRAVQLTRDRLALQAAVPYDASTSGGDPAGEGPDGAVVVEQRSLPREWPEGRFDLVVVSEVGYYLGADDLAELVHRAVQALDPDGTLLACHWRHDAPGYPGTAGGVRAAFDASGLARVLSHEEPDLLLDVWTPGEPSVARGEGWLA